MIEVDKKPTIASIETIDDKILRAAYASLKYYKTDALSNSYFIFDIAEAAGIVWDSDMDENAISGLQYELEQEGFIRTDKKTGLITSTDKLLKKFAG